MSAPRPKEPQMPAKPTSRQLNYLRVLANRTGQTFTNPKTSAEASVEIKRLKSARPSSRVEVRIERKQIADQIASGPDDAARVRDSEIAGHGSSATWVQNRDQEPQPTSDTQAPRRLVPNVGERIELARYRTDAGERVLYGQRIDGVVRVTDRPAGTASETDRAYLVERGLTKKDELDGLITDYLAVADRLHAIPMSLSSFERYLDAMSSATTP
jgi:hypothetical protein